MRNQDSIDDTTPLQSVAVSIPKEYNQGKDDNNLKNVCCCILLCLLAFLGLLYICITVGQRNRNKYYYG
tara:strand:- start:3065 stop:3271 length:207 start_codon:yes stop_codon:yes gene_type:complete